MPDNTWGRAAYAILNDDETKLVQVSGRDRWALEQLILAGDEGCTPIDNPAPRWSGYVFNLRELGIVVETVHELHEGPFSGTHGRYVLRSVVTRAESAGEAA